MNPPEFFSDTGSGGFDGTGNRPSPRRELQGPRPTALKVNKDSYKIGKPPVAPHPNHHHQRHPHPAAAAPPQQAEERKPVIIYAVSPKVIHTTVGDFMNLVQRLTGNTSETAAAPSGPGDISPAARIASIERTSPPKDREREIVSNGGAADNGDFDFVDSLLQDAHVEVGRTPAGVLSPAPGTLAPISSGFFSPVPADPLYNMFIPSPSTLFSAPMVSPSPTSCDLFNPFFDF